MKNPKKPDTRSGAAIPATPYRLAHGSPLSDAQAAQLLARVAQGEALNFAPVKRGHLWILAHLATLNRAERLDLARRLEQVAQVLEGYTVPAALSA